MTSSVYETFTYDLLNNSDKTIGRLSGVESGGSLTFSVSADVRGQGSLNVTKLKDVDWLHSRVRVSYNGIPLITAIPAVPQENYRSTSVGYTVNLLDKSSILLGDNFGGTYAVAAGSNIISKVVEVIQSTGETAIAIEASSLTLANDVVWEANTSKLRIVNDLLAAANYFALWCDGMGYFRSTPYTSPTYRGISYTFVDDSGGMYLPEFSRSYDPYGVPNRVICIGKTDGDAPLQKTAVDTTAPFGYPYRPWSTQTFTDVEYADAANLQAIADRKLADAQQVSETFEFTHPYLGFDLNEVVSFTNARLGTRLATVQKQTYSLTTGGLIKSIVRSIK